MKTVDILLATYNGEKYIKEQIESIVINFDNVSGYYFNLLISDDGSSDNTINIISDLCKKDKRIKIINVDRVGGVKLNFLTLLKYSNADYVFFSDQDDFWFPQKIEIFLEKLSSNEDKSIPLLVHSDLVVADENLTPIHGSMFSYQNLNRKPTFANCLVSNNVTGCVMACNKSLVDILKLSDIDKSIMHDWYASLLSHVYGEVVFIDKPLILYRQHGNNQIGAKKIRISNILNLSLLSNIKYFICSIKMVKSQSELLYKDLKRNGFDGVEIEIIRRYIQSFNKGVIERLQCFLFLGLKKNGFKRNVLFFILYVIFGKVIKY